MTPPGSGLSQQAREFLLAHNGPFDLRGAVGEREALERIRRADDSDQLNLARECSIEYALQPVDLDGVAGVWVTTPSTKVSNEVLLYFHGGAYVLGDASHLLSNAVQLGFFSGVRVLSVNYRRAPEHPFPAAITDALRAYRWLLRNGRDGSEIAMHGDSAGGGLVLAVVASLRATGEQLPAGLGLLSPWTDLTGSGDTHGTLAGVDPILGWEETLAEPARAYAGDANPAHPLISPVLADLSGFPPMLIQVGTREVLLSDAVNLARRAREAGTDVTLDVWDGMWHVWRLWSWVPESREATQTMAQFLVEHLQARVERVERDHRIA